MSFMSTAKLPMVKTQAKVLRRHLLPICYLLVARM